MADDLTALTAAKLSIAANYGRLASQSRGKTVELVALGLAPGMHTVQVNMRNNPARKMPVQCEALITWTIESEKVTRRITVGNGASISGAGHSVRVQLVDVSEATEPKEHLDYYVSVQLTPGVRPAHCNPPTLQPVESDILVVAPGERVKVRIPQDSGAISANVSVYNTPPSPIANQEARVYHSDSVSGAIFGGYDPRDIAWAPLHTGADELQLENNSASPMTFSVTFGIDG